MSRHFQSKNKDLVNLDVITADMVWEKSKSDKNNLIMSKKYDYFGKVEKGMSAFIVKTNINGENGKYIEDSCNLPKNAKNKVVDYFNNKNKRVVYLVKKKNEKAGIKK